MFLYLLQNLDFLLKMQQVNFHLLQRKVANCKYLRTATGTTGIFYK